MKALLLTLLLVTTNYAADVHLVWPAPDEGPAPGGYNIVVTKANGNPHATILSLTTNATIQLPVGNWKITVNSLASGNWETNAVTGDVFATEATLESDPSNEVTVSVRPAPSIKITLQSADSLTGVWSDIGVVASYDIREVDKKFLRAMVVHVPPALSGDQ